MSYEIKGKIILIEQVVEVTDKFRKREFVLETSEDNANGQTFTETIKFQLTQSNVGVADAVSVGDEVNVKFNIKGRKWEKDGKVSFFNNLDAWKIELLSDSNSGNSGNSAILGANSNVKPKEEGEDFFDDDETSENKTETAEEEVDDLPF